MPVSNMPIAERVARVLAAQEARRQAHGIDDDDAVNRTVDETWPQFTNDAVEVLKTLREPDATMAQAGNLVNWQAMIGAAIDDAGEPPHTQ